MTVQAIRSKQVRKRAMLGYGAVVVALAGAMVFATRQGENITRTTTAQIRIEERKSTLADQLRSKEDLMTELVGAFLISGDPRLRERLERGERDFDVALAALSSESGRAEGRARTDAVARNAARLRELQADIDTATPRPDNALELARAFEARTQPARDALRTSLDDLVAYEDRTIDDTYRDATRQRADWATATTVLIAALVACGLIVIWSLSTALARAFRREEDAHEVTRAALAANEELIAIVAHDLRNPLGAIALQASMLRSQTSDPTSRRQAASIENIASRMDYLIRTVVDASTLEAHRFVVQPGTCAVGQVIDAAMEMFQPVATSKRVQLAANVDERDLVLRGNSEQVLDVVCNLIGNALKFTPSQGSVAISVAHVGALAKFSVSDSGPGILPGDVSHVFERYWTKPRGTSKGTGLGLFIAKSIVEAYGGTIWVESSTSQGGAKFDFTIPIADARSA